MIARMKAHHVVALAMLAAGCAQARVATPPKEVSDALPASAVAPVSGTTTLPKLTDTAIEDNAWEAHCHSLAERIHAVALARDQGTKPEAALAAVKDKDDTGDEGAMLLSLTAAIYSKQERSKTPEQLSTALFNNCVNIGKHGVSERDEAQPGPLLLMAPMKPDGRESDPSAPLARWTHVGVSQSAKQCEQVILETVNEARPAIREAVRANFLCVATDDPRLGEQSP